MNPFRYLFAYSQYLLPQHYLSHTVGKLADSKIPWLKDLLISQFIKTYGVNMNEALISDPKAYASFNDFFIRKLKPEARQISNHMDRVLSPVDGKVYQAGDIKHGRIFQAKGHSFSLIELLGGNNAYAKPFVDGHFITLYLAPKDYHRIHMPLTGTLKHMIYVPGDLFAVNPLTATTIPNLFARNERIACIFESEVGPMAMVLVGAINVGSIHTQWAGCITPSKTGNDIRTWDYNNSAGEQIRLVKGEEMGYFKLGSTVILLFTKDTITWEENILANNSMNHDIKLGNVVGSRR